MRLTVTLEPLTLKLLTLPLALGAFGSGVTLALPTVTAVGKVTITL